MVKRRQFVPLIEVMREATTEETMDWLNGYVSGSRFVETENGLMVKERKYANG